MGLPFSYAAQPEPNGIAAAFLIGADFIGDDDVALVLGDNIFYGWHLGEQLQEYTSPKGAVVFGLWVPDPERYGVLEFGPDGGVVAVHEKPLVAPSNYMIPGLYFYAAHPGPCQLLHVLHPAPRGHLRHLPPHLRRGPRQTAHGIRLTHTTRPARRPGDSFRRRQPAPAPARGSGASPYPDPPRRTPCRYDRPIF